MAEGGAEGGAEDKKQQGGAAGEEGAKHKKLLRLLTVFAYLSTVSGTAFMLSLYYLFLWTPKVQLGGKALVQDPPPPGTLALFYPEMAPQLAARVDDAGPRGGGVEVAATLPQLTLPAQEGDGRRREARSTLMEMTTQGGVGGSSTAAPPTPPHTPPPPPPGPSTRRPTVAGPLGNKGIHP